MKVNISRIRELRGGVISFNGKLDAPDYKMDLIFTGPIEVEGTITNTGEGFLVKAFLRFGYKVNCSRCLTEYSHQQETELLEQFVPGSPTPNDDELVFYFNGEIIDLKECIFENVILSFPMNFICSPDCRGLCPQCGRNLNIEHCECSSEQINPQFAKLKNLLIPEGGGFDGKSKK